MSEILATRLGSIIPIENLPQQKIFLKSYISKVDFKTKNVFLELQL